MHCLEMCPHFSGVLVGRFHYTSYGVSGNECTVIYRAWPTICSYSHGSPYISLASYYHNTHTPLQRTVFMLCSSDTCGAVQRPEEGLGRVCVLITAQYTPYLVLSTPLAGHNQLTTTNVPLNPFWDPHKSSCYPEKRVLYNLSLSLFPENLQVCLAQCPKLQRRLVG